MSPDNVTVNFKLPINNELIIKKHNNTLSFLDNELNELANIEIENKEYFSGILNNSVIEHNRIGLPATVAPRKNKPTKS